MIINRAKYERMQRDIAISKSQIKHLEADNGVLRTALTAAEATDAAKDNRVLAEAIADLSRKLTARRDISKRRMEVIKTQTRTIANQSKAIDALHVQITDMKDTIEGLEAINVDRLGETSDAHKRADDALHEAHKAGDRITNLKENMNALREANQRLRQANSKALIRIEDLKKQIAQRDEEMRLLLCDIYKAPDDLTPWAIEHRPGQPDRFKVVAPPLSFAEHLQSKVEGLQQGLQRKNQEIGSQLGYYKQETAKLRKMLITAQHSRDAWKRKAHHQLIPVPVDFADRTVGVIV